VTDPGNPRLPSGNQESITEDWLCEVGFKWHQFDRQPEKQWLLWVGQASGQWGSGSDDLGVELAPKSYDAERDDHEGWFCWLRSDVSHRYSRFLHVRRLRTRAEVVKLVEGLTGQPWNPALHLYGAVHHPKHAKQLQADRERLDKQLAERPTWYDSERDATRGRPLREHMNAAIKNGGAR
jgi:hypothetical protein